MSIEELWAYLRRLLALALSGIRAQRLRALLSAVGITVGAAATVVILALGAGGREAVLDQIRELGVRNILIRGVPADRGTAGQRAAMPVALTLGDVHRLEHSLPQIDVASAVTERWMVAQARDREVRVRVVGATSHAAIVQKLPLVAGRFLVPDDGVNRRSVCVLGAEVARGLFGFDAPLGKAIRLGPGWYHVIGVLANRQSHRGSQGVVRTQDINRDVYVPMDVVAPRNETWRHWPVSEITLALRDERFVLGAARAVRDVLRSRQREQRYEVVVPLELVEQQRRALATFNLLMAGVGALSLLVGGVGIMNVMLATVTERTREIGIRRAVGATAGDVALHFLAEALVLSVLGGLLGSVLGIVAASMMQALGGWPVRIIPSAVVAVLGVSALCGIAFGLYPAVQAARCDPIDALRYE